MAAPCGSELPANSPLKIPKMEVLSPASPGGLSDGNPSLSDPSTPRGASPLGPGSAAGSGAAASGGLGLGLGGRSAASSSVSFSPGGGGGGAAAAAAAACRGMSWTPAETNALIAVWGNERLVEARYQQLEGAGTVFGSKAPGPAMYERVSRALAELGYERTPSQCRERIKLMCPIQTASPWICGSFTEPRRSWSQMAALWRSIHRRTGETTVRISMVIQQIRNWMKYLSQREH
ncbi:myb/SANT-like DNA-binding domain-containing protein 2 isoform X5 [Canis lupus baileyi]|nr:myb/SANT-like DNA-binding domain-containing protein 2 isoform X5 [Canis lupus familiaris]XP_025320887.1 myb/SANT-like DNA-binding domain-containing protein 2 isoform X5 [Canis lupus dingo]XP_038391734.1 myb/SANT-like DNA-binding domain-containing protein 2 isoform X5 [Canis lupus familiaris]XP_038520476.1 myb/SANT-like DNA-binding domain-containing protein 2 isoform X5 [Canis lupus familiaris]|eukprot:XP_013968811.1 myb/SANT-like DNA-binding domain-containing protein 2 isoform X4 [Canis lupus familiaris]